MIKKIVRNHIKGKPEGYKQELISGLAGLTVALAVFNIDHIFDMQLRSIVLIPITLAVIAFALAQRTFNNCFFSKEVAVEKPIKSITTIQLGEDMPFEFPLPAYIKNQKVYFSVDIISVTRTQEGEESKTLLSVGFRKFYSDEAILEFWNKIKEEEIILFGADGGSSKILLPEKLVLSEYFGNSLGFKAEVIFN